jgi:hypothetical protein
LNFAAGTGLGAFRTVENGGREKVAAGDGEIGGSLVRLRLFTKKRDTSNEAKRGTFLTRLDKSKY